MSTAPCKIEMNDDGDRVCMACGGMRPGHNRDPVDCPHRARPYDTSGYQMAAVILALCLGLSTCTIVGRGDMQQAKPVAEKAGKP